MLTTDPDEIRRYTRSGAVILGIDTICPVCYSRPKKGYAMTCNTCAPREAKNPGRPQTYTDDALLALIEAGRNTPNLLLASLGLSSKTTLIKRLRRLHAEGRVTMVERTRREGFTVTVRRG